jgi:sodium transport system ATP-binding protein
MIQVRDLTKSYADLRRGRFVALDGISFDARPGQIYGLLGPNGAGKTTALRILSTVLRPTAGTASIAGYDVVTQPSLVRHQIGFMSANTAVYDRMTAWEMVEHFGRLYGIEKEPLRERMEHLFERLQMQEIRDLLGAKMSTGMKQKVSIARTLIHDPAIVIFDEPTTGLDVVAAEIVTSIIGQCKEQGKTVLFSTHHMHEVDLLCDHVVVLREGRLCFDGTVAAMRERAGEDKLDRAFLSLIQPDTTRSA